MKFEFKTIDMLALKADISREYDDFTLGSLTKGILFNRTLRVMITVRLVKIVKSSDCKLMIPLSFILDFFYRVAVQLAGVDLPWQTEVGSGCKIVHGWGLVVSSKAKIGNNVTLFHGVTIGGRDRITSDGKPYRGFPVLEDNVWVGPNAIIVGDINIGHNSRIAGGAFVTDNVPPYSTVVGNPAAITKTSNPALKGLI